MNTEDLRTWQPTAADAKDVYATKMLDTEAMETPDTVTAVNKNVETVVKHPDFGSLGATGRA